jgi:hypothetical protein
MGHTAGRRIEVMLCLLLLTGAWRTPLALADIYKYVDRSGTVVMTDKSDTIPDRYRGKVTVIKDAPAASPAVAPAATETPMTTPSVLPESQADATWHEKYLLPVGLVAGLVVGFFLIRKVFARIGHRRVGTVLLLCLALGVGILAYRLYLERMAETFSKLRTDVLNIKKNVETRGEKSNNSIRDLELK